MAILQVTTVALAVMSATVIARAIIFQEVAVIARVAFVALAVASFASIDACRTGHALSHRVLKKLIIACAGSAPVDSCVSEACCRVLDNFETDGDMIVKGPCFIRPSAPRESLN